MKTCKRLLNFVQIINAEGDVRLCSWIQDNIIGNLQKEDMQDILNSSKAKELRRTIAQGDFSICPEDNCPYLANGCVDEILVDYDENTTYTVETLELAYEGNCNYACTCCTSYQHMMDTRQNDYTDLYHSLEEKIIALLPYVKHLGANGRGEFFASPRIMKLLSEWQPLSPIDEISVEIETNGSLFNLQNWKKIENLGKYHLSVYITIMSFKEDVYQYLSGTKLPMNNILDNLFFVKKLREQGVINELEIATVMQELNFREMPEFTRRCIEEFGADHVRIRPVFPGGNQTEEIQWFTDVRNPKHPYNNLFRRVMEHPIFRDSHVVLWSNEFPSNRGQYPGIRNAQEVKRLSDIVNMQHEVLARIKRMVEDERLAEKIKQSIKDSKIAVYGLGTIGKIFILTLKKEIDIEMVFDKKREEASFHGIPIKDISEAKSYNGVIVITPYGLFEQMKAELLNTGFKGIVWNLESLLTNIVI